MIRFLAFLIFAALVALAAVILLEGALSVVAVPPRVV